MKFAQRLLARWSRRPPAAPNPIQLTPVRPEEYSLLQGAWVPRSLDELWEAVSRSGCACPQCPPEQRRFIPVNGRSLHETMLRASVPDGARWFHWPYQVEGYVPLAVGDFLRNPWVAGDRVPRSYSVASVNREHGCSYVDYDHTAAYAMLLFDTPQGGGIFYELEPVGNVWYDPQRLPGRWDGETRFPGAFCARAWKVIAVHLPQPTLLW